MCVCVCVRVVCVCTFVCVCVHAHICVYVYVCCVCVLCHKKETESYVLWFVAHPQGKLNIKLDTRSEIFQNLHGALGKEDVLYQCMI